MLFYLIYTILKRKQKTVFLHIFKLNITNSVPNKKLTKVKKTTSIKTGNYKH